MKSRYEELMMKKMNARYFGGEKMTGEELIEMANLLHQEVADTINKYWETHKEVVEELPVADLKGAKIYADVFGYSYEVKMNNGVAVYYKNANDVGAFNNKLSEKWAVAVPKKSGYNLVIYKVVEI